MIQSNKIIKPKLLLKLSHLIMGLMMVGMGGLIFGQPIKNLPDKIPSYLVEIAMIVAGVAFLVKWLTLKTIVLKENELEVSNFLGANHRNIPRSQVISFQETTKSGESDLYKACTIHTSYGKIQLSERSHTNYAELLHLIREKWQIREDKIILG